MNKKIITITIMFLMLAMLATPVLAIGPDNAADKNPNAFATNMGKNSLTELWLPSGVMNEWINPPIAHQSGRAQMLSATNAEKPQAIDATIPPMIFTVPENTWVYYSNSMFRLFLMGMKMDPSRADAYPDGVYMRMIFVGW
jgi:hypothetical protein